MNLTKKLRYLVSLTSLLVCLLMGSVMVNAQDYSDLYSYVEETTMSAEDMQTYANGKITLGDAKNLVASYTSYFQQFSGCSAEEWEYIGKAMSYQTDMFTNFSKTVGDEDCGAYQGYGDVTVEETEEPNSVDVITVINFENKDYKMIMHVTCYDLLGPQPVSVEFSAANEGNETFWGKMASAGGNTLMGMGTVFVVLVFISLIISAFNFIPAITEMFSKKKSVKEEVKVEETASTSVVETVTNDTELIAVIAAAIAASEQVSTDSFVVRSIRRR